MYPANYLNFDDALPPLLDPNDFSLGSWYAAMNGDNTANTVSQIYGDTAGQFRHQQNRYETYWTIDPDRSSAPGLFDPNPISTAREFYTRSDRQDERDDLAEMLSGQGEMLPPTDAVFASDASPLESKVVTENKKPQDPLILENKRTRKPSRLFLESEETAQIDSDSDPNWSPSQERKRRRVTVKTEDAAKELRSEEIGLLTSTRKVLRLWSKQEDDLLKTLCMENGREKEDIQWSQLEKTFDRPSLIIKRHWNDLLSKLIKTEFGRLPTPKKIYQKWTDSEDELLKAECWKNGREKEHIHWTKLGELFRSRTASGIKSHWEMTLKPKMQGLDFESRGWTSEDDEELKRLNKLYNGDWKKIAFILKRPQNSVRVRIHTHGS